MSVATRTIKSLQDGVSGLLTRTNLNSVTNLFGAFERAFRTFQQKATVPEAMTSQIVTLYDDVIDYIAPAPVFGSTVKDIRPVGQTRFQDDMVYRKNGEDFDRGQFRSPSSGYNLTFETENGVNLMRVKTRFTPAKVVLDPMSATAGWTASGTASGLVQDTSFVYRSPASLKFNMTSGSGILTKTITTAADLTKYKNVGVIFLALDLPSASLTSAVIRIGSSSVNYYSVSVTQAFLGAFSVGGFPLVAFDLSTATTVGTPDITKMNYIQLTFAPTVTMNNVRVGYLWISLPSQHKVLFTTTGIFSASGVISNFITDENDVVKLTDAAYNLYEHECALTVGLQEGGSLVAGLTGSINSLLNGARAKNGQVIQLGLYDKYRADNPSEDIRMVGNWYND